MQPMKKAYRRAAIDYLDYLDTDNDDRDAETGTGLTRALSPLSAMPGDTLWTLCYRFEATKAGAMALAAFSQMGISQNLTPISLDANTVELPHCPKQALIDITNMMNQRDEDLNRDTGCRRPARKLLVRQETPWEKVRADVWLCRPAAFEPK